MFPLYQFEYYGYNYFLLIFSLWELSLCVCVCVCVCVRERERESVCVCVFIYIPYVKFLQLRQHVFIFIDNIEWESTNFVIPYLCRLFKNLLWNQFNISFGSHGNIMISILTSNIYSIISERTCETNRGLYFDLL